MEDFVSKKDCLDSVISFLSYVDCLRLGSTCLQLLIDIQRSLRARRIRFVRLYETRVFKCGYSSAPVDENDSVGSNISISRLPTVKTQVETLYHALPTEYPMKNLVQELCCAIEEIEIDEKNEDETGKAKGGGDPNDNCTFNQNFSLLETYSRAHRLHTTILNSVMSSTPPSRSRDGPFDLTQYVGDVLCVFCLLQSRDSRVIDKIGPDMSDWFRVLDHQHHCDYQVWLYNHVLFLQACPFPVARLERLGLSSMYVLLPSAALSSSSSSSALSQLRWSSHRIFYYRAEETDRRKAIRVTYNDFGRLGPTFRGRDHILSQRMSISNLQNSCEAWRFWMTDDSSSHGEYAEKWARLLGMDDSTDHVSSILRMHDESRRNRPMTVQPPQIRFVEETTLVGEV